MTEKESGKWRIQRKWLKKRLLLMVFQMTVLSLTGILSGCGMILEEGEERTEVEFTVVKQEEIPEEVKNLIETHREEEMQIVYEDNGFFYGIRGYGQQETGGYSIAVDECTETADYVFIATTLIGPNQAETLQKAPSYPVVVVKFEKREKEIIFE